MSHQPVAGLPESPANFQLTELHISKYNVVPSKENKKTMTNKNNDSTLIMKYATIYVCAYFSTAFSTSST